MHVRYLLGAALMTASASLSLGGCSGAASPTAPAMTSPAAIARPARVRGGSMAILPLPGRVGHPIHARSWLKHFPPNTARLYISDFMEDVVNVYVQAGSGQTPVGQITGLNGPQGLWVDINQNLWVANTNTNQLLAFRRGSTTPYKTLNDTNGFPAGTCGNNNKSLVYATDIASLTEGNGQTIDVYRKSDASGSGPDSVLTDPNSSSLYECAVDSKGDLFVTMSQSANPELGEVDEFLKGSTTPIQLITNLIDPIGITIDKYNALSIADAFHGTTSNFYSEFYIYDYPYIYGPASQASATGLIVQTALGKQQNFIWGADATNMVGQQWSYPSFTLGSKTSSKDLTIYVDGLALTPATPQ